MSRTQSIKDRFKYLRDLKTGWFYPDTPALNQKGLNELEEWFLGHYDLEGLPRPHIYPTPTGRVQFEIQFNPDKVVEVIVDLDTLIGELTIIAEEVLSNESLSLRSIIGWRRFNGAVKYGL